MNPPNRPFQVKRRVETKRPGRYSWELIRSQHGERKPLVFEKMSTFRSWARHRMIGPDEVRFVFI